MASKHESMGSDSIDRAVDRGYPNQSSLTLLTSRVSGAHPWREIVGKSRARCRRNRNPLVKRG